MRFFAKFMLPAAAVLLAASLGAAAAAAAKAAADTAAETIEITHVSGTAELPHEPHKIIVYDLGVLDNLDRLGVGNIAAIAEQRPLPAYLQKYADKKYQTAGTLFEPDYEAVSAIAPDIIFIAGRSQPKYKNLSRLAPTVDLTVSNAHYLSDMERNITLLGRIFHKQTEAKAQIAALHSDLAALRQKAQNQGTGLVILTTGGRISAYGPGSRFGLIYDAPGIKPAAAHLAAASHGQPVSPEFLLKTNPDWLFVIDRDAAIGAEGESARQILDNPLIRQTKAAKSGQIIYLDAASWYLAGGGLTGLHQTIDKLGQAFDEAARKRQK